MRPLALTAALFSLLLGPADAAKKKNYAPCGVRLTSVKPNQAAPGDTFVMKGEFGTEQGEKVLAINRGESHRLELVSWSPDKLEVRVPRDLKSGPYKVGIYCNELTSTRGSYSSGWLSFYVISAVPRIIFRVILALFLLGLIIFLRFKTVISGPKIPPQKDRRPEKHEEPPMRFGS